MPAAPRRSPTSADYAEAPPLTDVELELWRQTLQETYDWLRAHGIAYVFVIAPDKHAVYPEYLPPAISRREVWRSDQLIRHLRRHSDVPVVDLRQPLVAAMAQERVYHRTDSHWNDLGAYIAYQRIMLALGQQSPELTPVPRDAFETRTVWRDGLDLARMIGLANQLREQDLQLVPQDHEGQSDGRGTWRDSVSISRRPNSGPFPDSSCLK